MTVLAGLTPTDQPTRELTVAELLQQPIPDFLKGNIIFTSDRFSPQGSYLVMKPDGALAQVLTGSDFVNLAFAREPFSPDRTQRAVVAPDASDIIQIWIEDVKTGDRRPVTKSGAWSWCTIPFGHRMADASPMSAANPALMKSMSMTLAARHPPVLLLAGTRLSLINAQPGHLTENRSCSSRTRTNPTFSLYVMNDDGSNLHILSPSNANDYDPIWVK